ncbi:unnamed protein product, partial [Clonostachys chloroleuca]
MVPNMLTIQAPEILQVDDGRKRGYGSNVQFAQSSNRFELHAFRWAFLRQAVESHMAILTALNFGQPIGDNTIL